MSPSQADRLALAILLLKLGIGLAVYGVFIL